MTDRRHHSSAEQTVNSFGQDTALVSENGYSGRLVTLDCPLRASNLKHRNIGSPLYIAPWTEHSAEHDPNEPVHVGILVSIYHAVGRVTLELKHPKNEFSEPYRLWHEARGATPLTFKQVDWFTSSHFLVPNSRVFIGFAA